MIPPRRLNMAVHCLLATAERLPDATALVVVDPTEAAAEPPSWTYAQLSEAVRRAAGAMRDAGLRPGGRVLLRLENGPAFPVAYFGAIAAGGVAMPLSPQLSGEELSRIAAEAEPDLALVSDDAPTFDAAGAARLNRLDGPAIEPADTNADDPALLIYTSGTSGRPKGVLHAHRAAWARRSMHEGWHGIAEGDRVMHSGAFNWTYTLGCGLGDPWSVGATAIIAQGQPKPADWPLLAARHRPTVFATVPGLLRRIVKYGEGLGSGFASVTRTLSAGEALAAPVQSAWEDATGHPVLTALGMSECSTFVSASASRSAGDGLAGWPQPGRKVGVIGSDGREAEEGTLAVHRSDPGLMLGYWRDEQATEAAFSGDWFLTGDRVAREAGGALRYLGREDDQMNAQGYRVAPQEVEAALLSHPAVADCAVAEREVEAGLSVIVAWVVLEAVVDESALATWAADRLAAYKRPRAYEFVKSLPRSANGKLQRRALTRATH